MECFAKFNKYISFVFFCVLINTANTAAEPKEKDVLAAMKKAAGFMVNTVSTNGGYVYMYSEDLSQQWGEVPARKTQI